MVSFSEIAQRAVDEVASGDAVLFDVRRDDEWQAGHAKGAKHVPITELEAGTRPDIPEGAKVYVYCQAGGRAGRSVAILNDMGYSDVTSIGGLNDWRHAGGEIQS